MKKVMKNLTALFLSAVILLTSAIFVGATEQESATESTVVLQEDSINQYNLMLMAFKHSGTIRAATEADIEYPDYYAGSYINEDNDLVVKLTQGNLDKASTIREMTRSDNTVIESAVYSYKELVELKNSIWNKYLTLYSKYKNDVDKIDADLVKILSAFSGVGINQEINRVTVALNSLDTATLSAFQKYMSDSDNITFELCLGTKNQSASSLPIYSGDMITTSVGYIGSIGFRAKIYIAEDNRYAQGFLTACHLFVKNGNTQIKGTTVKYTDAHTTDPVPTMYENFGTVVDGHWGGNIDAAFVEIGSQYEMIAQTSLGKSLGDNYFTSIAQNGVVTMCGKSSQDECEGKVKDTSYNYTATENGITIPMSDTYRCNYLGLDGDSGGVVYKEAGGSNCIVGIHGGTIYRLFGDQSYVIKASNIYSYWSLYLY